MPHQERALAYARSVRHPAFFMEMRLGKTLVAIRWVQGLEESKNILVVAPITVLRTWEEELAMEGEKFLNLRSLTKPKRDTALLEAWESEERTWILLNYDGLRGLQELTFVPWDAVILDESTVIKNGYAQITKICLHGFRLAKHRAILCGLPAPEGVENFFSQFKFIHGHFMSFKKFWDWKTEYLQQWMYEWIVKPSAKQKIKEYVHDKAFILKRKDAGIGSKKIVTKRTVSMNAVQKKMYRTIVMDYWYMDTEGNKHETQYAVTAHMWLHRIAGGFDPQGLERISSCKFEEVRNLLNNDLKDQSVVIWCRFVKEGQDLCEYLSWEGIRTCFISGDVPVEERGVYIKKFKDKEVQVFIATEQVGQRGIDLSVADTAIYYSNDWSCEIRMQSEDRIVHPKKEKPLLYIDLVSEGSIDEDLSERIRDKRFNAIEVMTSHIKKLRAVKRKVKNDSVN